MSLQMNFVFHTRKQLPHLAWCVCILPEDSSVTVWHGDWVEVWHDEFVEGAWDAPFAERGFEKALTFAGTGGILRDDALRLVSGTDLQARLYSTQAAGAIFASNSLPFVMAASGHRLSDRFDYYSGEFLYQCTLGINRTRRSLPMKTGSIEVHENVNLDYREGSSVLVRSAKASTSPPTSYAEHIETLRSATGRTISNATDDSRMRRYEPVVTLSRGYDSVMVASIASAHGCTEALTFVDPPRRDVPAVEDSGRLIGEKLGMSVREFGHLDFHERGTPAEAEFCSAPPAIDYPLATLEEHLKGRMLMTGSFGDCILSKSPADALPDFKQSTFQGLCGSTMTEFRLRIGCVNFPPLFINGLHVEEIRRISCSEELAPWSVGGTYDRPIARRCAVEAGVPSDWFGLRKYGAGWGLIKAESELSESSQADLRAYLEEEDASSRPLQLRFRWHLMHIYLVFIWRFKLRAQGLKLIPGFTKRFTRPPIEDTLFHWGIDRTVTRYLDALDSE